MGAIRHYELAGTHCVEVPRMLFERDRVEDLEEYITQVKISRGLAVVCGHEQFMSKNASHMTTIYWCVSESPRPCLGMGFSTLVYL